MATILGIDVGGSGIKAAVRELVSEFDKVPTTIHVAKHLNNAGIIGAAIAAAGRRTSE